MLLSSNFFSPVVSRFIEMNYEDLVANQETESRRLIDYLGLDWDEVVAARERINKQLEVAGLPMPPVKTRL